MRRTRRPLCCASSRTTWRIQSCTSIFPPGRRSLSEPAAATAAAAPASAASAAAEAAAPAATAGRRRADKDATGGIQHRTQPREKASSEPQSPGSCCPARASRRRGRGRQPRPSPARRISRPPVVDRGRNVPDRHRRPFHLREPPDPGAVNAEGDGIGQVLLKLVGGLPNVGVFLHLLQVTLEGPPAGRLLGLLCGSWPAYAAQRSAEPPPSPPAPGTDRWPCRRSAGPRWLNHRSPAPLKESEPHTHARAAGANRFRRGPGSTPADQLLVDPFLNFGDSGIEPVLQSREAALPFRPTTRARSNFSYGKQVVIGLVRPAEDEVRRSSFSDPRLACSSICRYPRRARAHQRRQDVLHIGLLVHQRFRHPSAAHPTAVPVR